MKKYPDFLRKIETDGTNQVTTCESATLYLALAPDHNYYENVSVIIPSRNF